MQSVSGSFCCLTIKTSQWQSEISISSHECVSGRQVRTFCPVWGMAGIWISNAALGEPWMRLFQAPRESGKMFYLVWSRKDSVMSRHLNWNLREEKQVRLKTRGWLWFYTGSAKAPRSKRLTCSEDVKGSSCAWWGWMWDPGGELAVRVCRLGKECSFHSQCCGQP